MRKFNKKYVLTICALILGAAATFAFISCNQAERYYYSEKEPALNADGTAYDGNYWRYVDGVPTVWEIK